jgi:hypothetical protein
MKVAVWPGRTLAADLPKGWTDTQSCAVPGAGLGDFVGVGLFVGVGDLVGVGLLVGVGDLLGDGEVDGDGVWPGDGLLLVGGGSGVVACGLDWAGDGVPGMAGAVLALSLGVGEASVTDSDELPMPTSAAVSTAVLGRAAVSTAVLGR